MILINRIRAKFITIKRDPPAVLMGCWRVLLFLVWCKFLFLEFPCCFCTLERLGYFFTQYLVTFFVRLSYLVTILPSTWLLLYILYMQYALLVRAKIRTKLCSSRLIRVIFRLTPWQTHSLPPKWFILPICRNTDFMNRYDLGTSLK